MTDHETDAAFVERMEREFRFSTEPSGHTICEFQVLSAIDAARLIALARFAVTQPAAAPDARMREALERICDATPTNTNSPTAESMASWCHAVARCALNDVAAAAPDAGGWLPIESAPRNGSLILAAFDDHPVRPVYWVFGRWITIGCQTEEGPQPRKWMPLPSPLGAPSVAPAPGVGDAAIRDVLAERRRQVEEGWTAEHDDSHIGSEMALAAAGYAIMSQEGFEAARELPPNQWPWARRLWKPGSSRRMLVKAGALILAEIERLDRASLRAGSEGGK